MVSVSLRIPGNVVQPSVLKTANLPKGRDAKLPVYGVSYDSGVASKGLHNSFADMLFWITRMFCIPRFDRCRYIGCDIAWFLFVHTKLINWFGAR